MVHHSLVSPKAPSNEGLELVHPRVLRSDKTAAMDWTDEAIVLAARGHGEAAVLVLLLTREHGRHAGLVRGGRASARSISRAIAFTRPARVVDRASWALRLRADPEDGRRPVSQAPLKSALLPVYVHHFCAC